MKSHDFDPVSFIAGIVMLVVGMLFLIPRATSDLVHYLSSTARWIWPAMLIAAGVAIVVPAIMRAARDTSSSERANGD
jgi:uncharacterized integral membrane protein